MTKAGFSGRLLCMEEFLLFQYTFNTTFQLQIIFRYLNNLMFYLI